MNGYEENVLGDYDVMTTAGEGMFWLSQILHDLAVDVGIPPPQFFAKRLFNDPRGVQKWKITTIIWKLEEDPEDYNVEFTSSYPDYTCSISVAMQCAIAHICHKYRTRLTHGSAYRLFAERDMEGEVVDRRHQHLALIRRYLMEREFTTVNMEVNMRRQVREIDLQRFTVGQLEHTVLELDKDHEELKKEFALRETTILDYQGKLAHSEAQFQQVSLEKGKLQEEVDRLQQMLAQMTVAKLVQVSPAPPAPAAQEAPIAAEAEEEEDPEEREFYNSSEESVASVESTARTTLPPKKRQRAGDYLKLFKVQP